MLERGCYAWPMDQMKFILGKLPSLSTERPDYNEYKLKVLNNDVSVMIINCDLYGWLYHAMNSEINHVHVRDIFYVLIIALYCFKNNKILYPDKMTHLEVKQAFFSFHCAY